MTLLIFVSLLIISVIPLFTTFAQNTLWLPVENFYFNSYIKLLYSSGSSYYTHPFRNSIRQSSALFYKAFVYYTLNNGSHDKTKLLIISFIYFIAESTKSSLFSDIILLKSAIGLIDEISLYITSLFSSSKLNFLLKITYYSSSSSLIPISSLFF